MHVYTCMCHCLCVSLGEPQKASGILGGEGERMMTFLVLHEVLAHPPRQYKYLSFEVTWNEEIIGERIYSVEVSEVK